MLGVLQPRERSGTGTLLPSPLAEPIQTSTSCPGQL
jgi:hypothetical protein